MARVTHWREPYSDNEDPEYDDALCGDEVLRSRLVRRNDPATCRKCIAVDSQIRAEERERARLDALGIYDD